MELGEEPEETARRELIEETGFAAQTIEPRGFIYTTPGFTDEKIFLFEARDLLHSDEYVKDEDEIIEVVDIPTAHLRGMIRDGTIVDAKTICLIYHCLGC
jgi:ADP-ribose pyrophosphatase